MTASTPADLAVTFRSLARRSREAIGDADPAALGDVLADLQRHIDRAAGVVGSAPDADAVARAIFARKKNLRLLLTGALPDPLRGGQMLAVIAGGLLVQDRDNGHVTRDQLKCVTRRTPTERELADCLFAWTVAKHVKSNAIVYAKDGATAGIGAGHVHLELVVFRLGLFEAARQQLLAGVGREQ